MMLMTVATHAYRITSCQKIQSHRQSVENLRVRPAVYALLRLLTYGVFSGTHNGWPTHWSIHARRRNGTVSVLTIKRRAQMLTANDRLRSGATARTGAVAMSYFETARTEPIHLGASPLPGGATEANDPDLRYVYGRVMECLGSQFNDASFVALVKQIHQVKTKVRSHSPSLLILRFLWHGS